MITPINTTYYQPIYIYSDDTTTAEKCFEKPENADLLVERLENKQLDEEEATRIATCVEEHEREQWEFLKWFWIVVGTVVAIALLIAALG